MFTGILELDMRKKTRKMIKIKKDSGFIFSFYGSMTYVYDRTYCRWCGNPLNLGYTYIIKELRKKNLLPKDFITECCFCSLLKHSHITHIEKVYNYGINFIDNHRIHHTFLVSESSFKKLLESNISNIADFKCVLDY